MKKIIVTYGLISGSIIVILSLGTFLFWQDAQHYNNQWLGYLVMIVALSLIFFGVKSYRDNQLGGVIKFKNALWVGLGISLVSSVLYTASWEVYFQTSDSDFMEGYATAYINDLEEKGATELEIAAARAEMEKWTDLYKNPLLRIPITFAEIIPVGIIISLISAGLLRKSEVLPHSANVS